MIFEDPPDVLVQTEIGHATHRNGWLIDKGTEGPWIRRASRHVPGTVAVAGAPGGAGPFFLAVEHPGVVAEIGLPRADLAGPGLARFLLRDTAALHAALSRAWDLANALPDNPLHRFEEAVRDLPRETEAERLVVERRGQDIFRESLLSYWDRRCPLTGIDDPALLRASHIKPWRDCATDAERLDPYNGLLLSALWDAAFDAGRVTFDDTGAPVFSSRLSDSVVTFFGRSGVLALTDQHRAFMRWHRNQVFRE